MGALIPTRKCRYCGAAVIFVPNKKSGKKQCLEAKKTTVFLLDNVNPDPRGRPLSEPHAGAGISGYRDHHGTCPQFAKPAPTAQFAVPDPEPEEEPRP